MMFADLALSRRIERADAINARAGAPAHPGSATLDAGGADLLLLDTALPDMSGLEVCRAVRRSPRHFAVPILFLTANGGTQEMVEAFAAGADDFVLKPFRAPELGAGPQSQNRKRSPSHGAIPSASRARTGKERARTVMAARVSTYPSGVCGQRRARSLAAFTLARASRTASGWPVHSPSAPRRAVTISDVPGFFRSFIVGQA